MSRIRERKAAALPSVQVAFATDEEFIPHTTVSLYSLAENSSLPVSATILFHSLSNEAKRALLASVAHLDVRVAFVRVDLAELADLPAYTTQRSLAPYFRLQLPSLLPADVDRILYLDSDTVCRGDIATLWATYLEGHVVGAVREATFKSGLSGRRQRDVPEIVPLRRAFNSGVLLIDLKRWRAEDVSARALRWRRASNNSRLHDQDALNSVLEGRWLELSARWNFGGFARSTAYIADRHRRRLNPVIIHYGSATAPWNHTLHPYRRLYHHYRSKTVWKTIPRERITGREWRRRRIAEIKWVLRRMHFACWPYSYGRAVELAGLNTASPGGANPMLRSTAV